MHMLRSILIAAVFAAAGIAPAYAASMAKCDDASIAALQTKVDAMTDQTKKTAATKQVTLAKDAMKAHKMKNCVTHMENAEKGMSKM
jgi:opacity protein-like surface antigen